MGGKPRAKSLGSPSPEHYRKLAAGEADMLTLRAEFLRDAAAELSQMHKRLVAEARAVERQRRTLLSKTKQVSGGKRYKAPKLAAPSVIRERLERLLREHDGNVSAVAREMDCARIQVHRWCQRFNLSIGSFRGEDVPEAQERDAK